MKVEIKVTGTPEEINKLLNAICGSKEQLVVDVYGNPVNASSYLAEHNNRKQDPSLH